MAEATLRGLGMFVMLLLFFAVITATRRLLDNSLGLGGALQLVAYNLPRIFLFTLPMSILYGTLHAFAELSTRGEIIGMWGGGMSFRRMMVPPLLWALVLAIGAFGVQEMIVPGAEQAKDKVLASQIANSDAVQRDIEFESTAENGVRTELRAEELNAKTKTLLQPRVYQFTREGHVQLSLHAQKARWNQETGKWRFEKPDTRNWNESSEEVGTASAGSDWIEFEAPTPADLAGKARTQKENLEEHNFEFVSIAELRVWREFNLEEAQKPGQSKSRRDEFKAEADGATFGIHDKIATPLICVALVLIGVPLGLRPQRSAGGFSLGLSLMILLVYYVVWTWASQVGKKGTADPYLMAYLPLALTLIAGISLSWKKAR